MRLFNFLKKNKKDEWEVWQKRWSKDKVEQVWGDKIRKRSWINDPAYRIISDNCRKHGTKILDIACGGGLQYAALKEYLPQVYYTGIDITPRHIQFCKSTFPQAKFLLSDAARLPFKDKEFDTCIVRHLIEHHPKEKAADIIREAMRAAKDCLQILFFIAPADIEEEVIERRKKSGFYVNTYSKRFIMSCFQSCGRDYRMETISIPKSPASPALYDQELYILNFGKNGFEQS